MQRLEVSGAVRPLKGSLGVKGLIFPGIPSNFSCKFILGALIIYACSVGTGTPLSAMR